MNTTPPKSCTHFKTWQVSALAVACVCATALAAPPGLGLPDMPPEKAGPTTAELEAQKRASQQAVQQAERRAAEQRAAAQREADQAKADKAAAEAKTRELERKLADAEAKASAAEATAKAAREAQDKAQAATTQAVKVVTTTPTTPAPAPATPTTVAPPPPPAPTPIPNFTRLPSVAGGPMFIVLPLQSFQMGSADSPYNSEKPVHTVRVSQRIAMSEMEVTTAQYMACANDTRQGKPACDQPRWNITDYQKFVADNQPIVGVTWHNARQYATWLSSETGDSYKIPTEAEWEYACRAGGNHTYCGSNNADAVAWYSNNTGGPTHKGGSRAQNAWGLFDMSGNVWEWVADCYAPDEYQRRKNHREAWPAHQTSIEKNNCLRVMRGGSWGDVRGEVRSANRSRFTPDSHDNTIGFRLARTLP